MKNHRTHEDRWNRVFRQYCTLSVFLPLIGLVILLLLMGMHGLSRIDLAFLIENPSRRPELAGFKPALVGSIWLISLTTLLSVPLGIGAAIYLEEYGGRSWASRLVDVNIANLAAVPSIIYGLLGLGVFVRTLQMDRSLIAGACTLSLLIMPIIVVASRESLRTIPETLREAGAGLGATQWQTIRKVVLPLALPGILTGSILAISRAIGETAPLIVVGALAYITFLPSGVMSPYTAMPIQIYDWIRRPQPEFVINAAAGIIVLLGTMMAINAVAVWLRYRLQRHPR